MHLPSISRQHTQLFYRLFAGAAESAGPGPMVGCKFGKILNFHVPKSQKGSSCFLMRNFQSRQSFTLWNPVFTRR